MPVAQHYEQCHVPEDVRLSFRQFPQHVPGGCGARVGALVLFDECHRAVQYSHQHARFLRVVVILPKMFLYCLRFEQVYRHVAHKVTYHISPVRFDVTSGVCGMHVWYFVECCWCGAAACNCKLRWILWSCQHVPPIFCNISILSFAQYWKRS